MQTWLRRFLPILVVALAFGVSACSHRGTHGHNSQYLSHHHGPYDQGYYRYRHHYPRHVHNDDCGHTVAYHYY